MRRNAVAIAVAAAALVVLAAALEGPARIRPIGGPPQTAAPVTPPPLPDLAPVLPHGAAPGPLPWVATVLSVVIAIAALVLLVAVLLRLIARRRRHAASVGVPIAGESFESGPEEVDAPVVRRGIAAALAALDQEREPRDAVVRAWLGLQQSAEDAGFRRYAAETPTEFATRVLARSAAADRPLATLLRLYRRARFGAAGIGRGDVDGARDALLQIQAAWAVAEARA